MNIDIFFTILFTSALQSIFGTGILLFGTPVLLMLGNNFQTTLTILLPASILVNCFQIRNNFKNIDQHFYKNLILFCLPGIFIVLYLFQSKEVNTNFIIGILTIPTSAIIELNSTDFSLSSVIFQLSKNKIYNTASKSIEVILASQAHQVPQVGFPQIEPVTNAIILNTKPDGARLFVINEKFLFLKTKIPKDKIDIIEKIPREIQADGTCTYIILTLSLCL